MKNRSKNIGAGVRFALALFASFSTAWADDEMAEASRFVEQTRVKEAATALTVPLQDARQAVSMPRFYRKGDRWVVAVSHASHAFMRKMDDTADEKVLHLDPQYYLFKVVQSDDLAATIEVAPVTSAFTPVSGSRIEKAVIVISKDLEIASKTVHRRDASVAITSQNPRPSNVSAGFSAMSIVLPEFKRTKPTAVLELNTFMPEALTEASQRHPIDQKKLVRFNETDLFGRSVRIDWQRGDLWPARVQTTSSYSLLIAQELVK